MKNKKGFTLIELLVVITIIAILSTIGLTVYGSAQQQARDGKRKSDLIAISHALEQYKVQNKTYTPSTTFPCVSSWGAAFNNAIWGVTGTRPPGCITSLKNAWAAFFQNIPQDPFCSPTSTSCSSSWLDYFYDNVNQGEGFVVSAKLENPPSPAMSGCFPDYNYCIKNQQ